MGGGPLCMGSPAVRVNKSFALTFSFSNASNVSVACNKMIIQEVEFVISGILLRELDFLTVAKCCYYCTPNVWMQSGVRMIYTYLYKRMGYYISFSLPQFAAVPKAGPTRPHLLPTEFGQLYLRCKVNDIQYCICNNNK